MSFAIAALIVVSASAAENPAKPAIVAAVPAAALPSGASIEFREEMVGWKSGTQESVLRARNGGPERSRARLDRLEISSRFGWRSDPITGVDRRHAGIDLPSRFGSPVMATGPGVVRIAGWAGGYGNLVEIEHAGGVRIRYGHLSRIDVHPAQHVIEGQVIGEVGSTGHSTGPHLHFEVRVGGEAVDPLTFVGQTMPVSDTVWAADTHVAPRWAWGAGNLESTLPEVSLR